MNKFIPFAICGALFLGACGERPVERVELMCDDTRVSARVFRDRVDAKISGERVNLRLSQSASGARYIGTLRETGFILWSKGGEWLLLTIADDKEDISICTRK